MPDTKDWTWVLRERCPQCGFDSRSPQRSDLAALCREVGDQWEAALSVNAAPRQRPAPQVWSPLEYGCHVRDVFDLFDVRMRLMLAEDGASFANWDQDETAIAEDYAGQDPQVVSAELGRSADGYASVLDGLAPAQWERSGSRDGGATFTVDSLTRYLLHDAIHHLVDVTGRPWS